MPYRPLRRRRAALRSERPLHLLVSEMSEITITPTLETERLILRPLALSDATAIQRHFDNWNIIQHLAQVVPWPYPEDGAVTFITRELERVAAGEVIYNWMLVLRGGDGEAIGNIRLRPWVDDPKGNRGFWLAERYWNQGLMTEAVSAVNDFAFRVLGVEAFYACNAATNVASRRVKQKTGAELVGYLELSHHNGQTLAERWRVTRESWLRRHR
jgi:ribosomal-protein-alanine N-acetyltransferase